MRVEYGRDQHHITEAQYKAVARAAPGVRTGPEGQRCPVDEGQFVTQPSVTILDYGSG